MKSTIRFLRLWCIALSLLCMPIGAYAVVDKVLYDDYANVSFSDIVFAQESSASAYQGTKSILMQPDQWHGPYVRLAAGRTDFRPYDALEFFIRSPYAQISPQFLVWDYGQSHIIQVDQYTQGGVVDAVWRKVSIPIKNMVSSAFAMDSVFIMSFKNMAKPFPFYVDHIVLRSTSTPILTGTEMRSARSITLKFKAFSIPLTQAGKYSVSSNDDVRYQLPQAITTVGIDRQAIATVNPGVPGLNPNATINESRLHLWLPFPMQAGKHYQVNYHDVRRDNGIYPTQATTTIIYDPNIVNGSVQVNQVGYMPQAPKRAFVGNWLGTAGAMPIDQYTFQVVDAYTQAVVYQSTITPRSLHDLGSGNDVYVADFSSVTQTGRYYLNVPSIGRSYSFDIKPDVFEAVYRTTMRVLYHKRNSALIPPYVDAGRERSAGIAPQWDGVFIPDMYASPLSNGEQPGQFKQIAPGWFDAGDLGEYITNQALIWSTISTAMDLAATGSFQDNELNIPESGNGIPDILDELSWGSRWAMSMQDQRDGGVYWRVCSASWVYLPPYQINKPRYIFEKTTVATAQFSAMMAIYARLIAPYDAIASNKAKAAAIQAWNYLQTHVDWPAEGSVYHSPPSGGCGDYPVHSSKPSKVWAAAELYRLTGTHSYQQSYENIINSMAGSDVTSPWPDEITSANWAMIMSQHANRDPYLTQVGRKWVMMGANVTFNRMNTHTFYSSNHPFLGWVGWHSFSSSVMATEKLLQAYYITHDTKYRDMAWISPNIELGSNPQNRSYITGIGDNPPLHPLDTSVYDPYSKIIRGEPVPGVSYHLPGFRQPYIALNQSYYPPELVAGLTPAMDQTWGTIYPVLRRYTDSNFLIPMAEPTVKEEAFVATAFALLRNANLPTQTSPTPYIWQAGQEHISISFEHIPLADVPLLSPARITAFGFTLPLAAQTHIAQLTPEQVAAIQSPQKVNYWVAKLTTAQKKGLTPTQIASFTNGTLFLDLLPEQVPLMTLNNLRTLKNNALPLTNALWMQQLTLPQLQEIQSWPIWNWTTNLSITQKDLLAGTLVDTQAPTIQLPIPQLTIITANPSPISVSDTRIQSWFNTAQASDNLGLAGILQNNSPYHFTPGTSVSITFTATDMAGHTSIKTGIIQVILDQTAPIMTAPKPIIVPAMDAYGTPATDTTIQTFLFSATAKDNIDASLKISHDAPSYFPMGVTKVTFTSTDTAGNTTSTSSKITIIQATKPVPTPATSGGCNIGNHQPFDPTFPLLLALSGMWLYRKKEQS